MGLCLYKHEEIVGSKTNILFQVIGCIYYAIKQKLKRCRRISLANQDSGSWIDVSTEKYPEHFVDDVCAVMKVCVFKLRRQFWEHGPNILGFLIEIF